MTDEPGIYSIADVITLTGATEHQLRYWQKLDLIYPSIQDSRGKAGIRKLFSAQDVEAVKKLVKLRKENSLQSIRMDKVLGWKNND